MSALFLLLGQPGVLPGPSCPAGPPAWYAAEAVAGDYDNVAACGLPPAPGCSDPIRYQWRPLASGPDLDLATLPAGTSRVRASCAPLVGAATLEQTTELVVRTGDDPVGLTRELLGVPFVLLPTVDPQGVHQTDARLGADCVALVTYARRRLGEDRPYLAPRALAAHTEVVASPQPGDVLDFGFQTALLARDLPPVGVLDPTDQVLHSFHGRAEEVALGALPYAGEPVVIRRWR